MRNLIKTLPKALQRLLLGTVSCFLLSGLASPMIGKAVAAIPLHATVNPAAQVIAADRFLGDTLTASLQEAQTTLLAQGSSSSSGMRSYVAVMSEENVVPNSPNTRARGAAGAVLSSDNRLVIRGRFKDLSSQMRDYATDPVNPPNTSITSAFHIHQGDPNENGPFQYALDVTLDGNGRDGSAAGEYQLTPQQAQALMDGRLYVDIHTTKNRGGEMRAVLMPY